MQLEHASKNKDTQQQDYHHSIKLNAVLLGTRVTRLVEISLFGLLFKGPDNFFFFFFGGGG
jgi:hypothetical protein